MSTEEEVTNLAIDFMIWIGNIAEFNISHTSPTAKADSKWVFGLIQFILTDGDLSCLPKPPTGHWEWKPIENAYRLAPPSIAKLIMPVIQFWKLEIFAPKATTPPSPPPPSPVPQYMHEMVL